MKKKNKEYEVVARFKKGNCYYTVRQPKEPATEEELRYYYSRLIDVLYN